MEFEAIAELVGQVANVKKWSFSSGRSQFASVIQTIIY